MDVTQPVARTAFYCAVIRADDAAAAKPICGDSFAARFVDDHVRRDLAAALALPRPAQGNVARHRLIDDIARNHLSRHPSARVILIGAGFDTRAYRLNGGRWFELDDPPMLAFKEQRLPASESPNPLTRIPVAFGAESPDAYLAPLAGDDEALIVLEGVSMYLSDGVLRDLALAIARACPRATLVTDLMTPFFGRTFSRSLREALGRLGASFGERSEHPRLAFEAAGFRAERPPISIPGQSFALQGGTPPPRWLMATLLRGLRDGYMLYVFRQVAR